MTEEEKVIYDSLLCDYNYLRKEGNRLKEELGLITKKMNIIRVRINKIRGNNNIKFSSTNQAMHLYNVFNNIGGGYG